MRISATNLLVKVHNSAPAAIVIIVVVVVVGWRRRMGRVVGHEAGRRLLSTAGGRSSPCYVIRIRIGSNVRQRLPALIIVDLWILLNLLQRGLQAAKGRVGHVVHGHRHRVVVVGKAVVMIADIAGAAARGRHCVGVGGVVVLVVVLLLGLVSLAGEQRDVDFLHHLNAVQHLAEGVLAEGLRRVPDGGVGHAGPLRLQVEHVVARFHAFGAGRKEIKSEFHFHKSTDQPTHHFDR